MSHQVATNFPDQDYSSSNKPGTTTLKTDIQNLEDSHNAHDSDTAIHITALSVMQVIYPIGSIYTNAGVATNPATLFGFGTWEAFGAGRVIVGLDAGQTEFDVLGETGGEKTHALTEAELAVHTHVQNAHSHTTNIYGSTGNSVFGSGSSGSLLGTEATGDATATNQNTGSGTAHNNLQPYIVAYMWKRTA